MSISFGNVPHPPFLDRLIPDSQNDAWDDLGPRRPVGICQHSMLGTLWGTDGYFRRGRESTGLTDYGIGGSTDGPEWDGVILRWNDPRGRATTVSVQGSVHEVSANRAPWANGGSDDLEGDGPLFVRTLGVGAINRDLVSIERSDGGEADTPVSPRQFEKICALSAHWFDQGKVPWDRFPIHPGSGIVTHLMHYEFASKGCPYAPVRDRIDEIQARIRQILKAGQTATAIPPAPDPNPPVPAPAPAPKPDPITRPDLDWWPQGYDLATLRRRFGALQRHDPGGTITLAPFDERGVISNAWVARGVQERRKAAQLPPALHWWSLRSTSAQSCDLVTFADRWTLYRPDPAVVWSWIE